jgi:hypothetical protein
MKSYRRHFFLKCIIAIVVILFSGCATNQLEHDFFGKEYDQAGTRIKSYPIADQIKIYLYGMQEISPPKTALSIPIAERGGDAIPDILNQLNTYPTEQNIRDLMVIFEMMQRVGSYDVRHDKLLMKKLDGYINGMKNEILRGTSKNQLYRIRAYENDSDLGN